MPCTASRLRAGRDLPQTTRTRFVCVIVAYCRHTHDQHRAWMARLLSVHRLTVRNDIRTRKLAKPASSHLHKGVVKAPGGNSWDGIYFVSHRLSNFAKVRL